MAIEKILHTLQTHDPEQATLTVGGAAIAVHFAEAGLDFDTADVDVLCSEEFFAEKTAAAIAPPPDIIKHFQIRYPHGAPQVRALSPVLDIYPGEKIAGNTLPFSATNAMGGQWHPTAYESCVNEPQKLVKHAGYLFLSMAEVLLWTAKGGRQKDIVKVDALLPVSLDRRLISNEEHARIKAERDYSAALRVQHPHRHHARVEP